MTGKGNPKLQAVAAEIETVLRRHDVTGLVLLGSPTHTDFLISPDASWTCAFTENTPEGKRLRLRSKRENYSSREEQRKVAAATVGVFLGWVDAITGLQRTLLEMVKATGWEVDHMSKEE